MLVERSEVQLSSRLLPYKQVQAFFSKLSISLLLCVCEKLVDHVMNILGAQRRTELSICSAWAACHCLALHVYLMCFVLFFFFLSFFGRGEVYISLYIFLCIRMVYKWQEMNIYNRWVRLSKLFCYLLWFFSSYYCAWNLKLSPECRMVLALVLRNSFTFGWELSCWKVLMEAFFLLLLIIISFPLTRDR